MSDKRIVKSKRSMENAFFELLETKSPSEISVRNICDKAEVSRSTFYDHYEDYPFFLRQLEERVVELMLNSMQLYKFDTDTDAMVDAIFKAISDKHNLFGFIFDNKINTRARTLFVQKSKELTRPVWVRNSDLNIEEADLLLEYMLAGSMAILQKFWSGQISIPEQRLKELYSNFIKYGVYHYIYKRK